MRIFKEHFELKSSKSVDLVANQSGPQPFPGRNLSLPVKRGSLCPARYCFPPSPSRSPLPLFHLDRLSLMVNKLSRYRRDSCERTQCQYCTICWVRSLESSCNKNRPQLGAPTWSDRRAELRPRGDFGFWTTRSLQTRWQHILLFCSQKVKTSVLCLEFGQSLYRNRAAPFSN